MSEPIADLINQLMEITGLKRQKELAELISERLQVNLPAPRFSDWKRGARNPTARQAVALVAFARQYGIDVDPLVLAGIRPSHCTSTREQEDAMRMRWGQSRMPEFDNIREDDAMRPEHFYQIMRAALRDHSVELADALLEHGEEAD